MLTSALREAKSDDMNEEEERPNTLKEIQNRAKRKT